MTNDCDKILEEELIGLTNVLPVIVKFGQLQDDAKQNYKGYYNECHINVP